MATRVENKSNVVLDQYYTKPMIATTCWDKYIELIPEYTEYDYILEPSAGTGSFFRLLPIEKRIGIDIDPKMEGITQQDFFSFTPDEKKTYIVIGNPPFGKQASVAIKFFNKCAEFADVIGFIVPRTFKRVSVQNKLNLNFGLIHTEDLPMNECFEPNVAAKCCFQIWKKDNMTRPIIRLPITHRDFKFLPFGPLDEKKQPTPPQGADFALKAYGSNCGEIVETGLSGLRPKSWHWIKSNIDKNVLIGRLKTLDYSISRDSSRQDSIGKKDLIQLYINR